VDRLSHPFFQIQIIRGLNRRSFSKSVRTSEEVNIITLSVMLKMSGHNLTKIVVMI